MYDQPHIYDYFQPALAESRVCFVCSDEQLDVFRLENPCPRNDTVLYSDVMENLVNIIPRTARRF